MNGKIETKTIQCEKTKKHVSLVYEYAVKSADQISYAGKQLSNFHCSDELNCPFVAINNGNSISFDWKNCPYYPNKNEL